MNIYDTPQAALDYDKARQLPVGTQRVWREVFAQLAPPHEVQYVLDVGCGTGRFTHLLAETYHCPIVGVEPAAAMLDVARRSNPDISWRAGRADDLPCEDVSMDVVLMSQVYHHLPDPLLAFREVHRVLTPTGRFLMRNGTQENNALERWMEFFPEARALEEQRAPTRQAIVQQAARAGLLLQAEQVVLQRFAETPLEYARKINARGLSALLAISDAAFQQGAADLQAWAEQAPASPVDEAIDVLVFTRNETPLSRLR